MTPPMAIGQPVLVYTRIAQNRRKTVLLVALSVLALVPFIVGISYGFSLSIVRQVNPSTKPAHRRLEEEEVYYQSMRSEIPAEDREDFDARVERHLARERAYLAKKEAAQDPNLLLKMMLVIGAALTAALGLLFWGIGKSPAAKLLSEAGAWPAGSGEAEAARLLENLAIGAGLPTPKLYVIETDTPNAFAAGISPDHAVVAVTRGALKLLDRRELEGVLAHEISHIGNRDIRLNAIAASVALFLRIPYLIFRRNLSAMWEADFGNTSRSTGFSFMRRSLRLTDLALSPLAVYILVVAPVLGALVRAAISREREFLADADGGSADPFSRGPDARAGQDRRRRLRPAQFQSGVQPFLFRQSGRGHELVQQQLAGHPSADRGPHPAAVGFRVAARRAAGARSGRQGRQAIRQRARGPEPGRTRPPGVAARDELDHLNQGNPMGRVFRVIATEPVPLYDDVHPGMQPLVIARINPAR